MDAGVRESSEALGGAGPKLGRIGFVRLGAWPSLCLCVLAYLLGGRGQLAIAHALRRLWPLNRLDPSPAGPGPGLPARQAAPEEASLFL